MSWDGDRDLCDRCGNLFLPEQVCDPCRSDSEIVRAAAHVIRLRLRPGRRRYLNAGQWDAKMPKGMILWLP